MSGAPDGAVRAALDVLGKLGQADAPLGALTTYRVGGSAAVLTRPGTLADLEAIRHAVQRSRLPVLVVGRGSNLLVADAGFPGLAVVLDAGAVCFATVAVEGTTVRAGVAVPLPALARQSVEAGLTGLEWAVGVPGSVGGGVRMNVGGHGSDVAHALQSCRLFDVGPAGDGAAEIWARDRLQYGYRHSALRPTHVVVDADFALAPGDRVAGLETIRQIVRWRREHQPGGQNAGSVFTNPAGEPPRSAGGLIDAAGLKGVRHGTAAVSEKHANFIQADPGGSADDIVALMRLVQAEVLDRFDVTLQAEVRMVGFPPDPSFNTHLQVED